MKVWELEKGKEYVSGDEEFFVGNEGHVHIRRKLKRNGLDAWFDCQYSYNQMRNMEFEIKMDKSKPVCTHRDKSGKLTLQYEDAYEMSKRDMWCTQCREKGSREDFLSGLI